MSLEGLLKDFAGQTDADVEDEANRIEVSQVVADLIRRLKKELIDKASSEDEVKKIENDSKNGCSFFYGKEDELTELLKVDLENNRGLPFSPKIMKKCECGRGNCYHYFSSLIPHSTYGSVIKFDGREVVERDVHKEEFISKYNLDQYHFNHCGHTREEIEELISGNEEYFAEDLAKSHSDWCLLHHISSGDKRGEAAGAINQIPGYPGTCKEELRVLVPLKAVVTWKRLEETASLLIRCSTIHTLGFVIGEESSGTGEKFKRVWKQFHDDGNFSRFPMDVGLIIANGDASEKIQRWGGSNWS